MPSVRTVDVCNYCRKYVIDCRDVVHLFHLLDTCKDYNIPPGDLSVSFVSAKKIKQLHGQFLDDYSFTDVITFLGDSSFNFCGEVVVSPEYAYYAAKKYKTTISDELTLYLLHGYLHLSGLDDRSSADAMRMRAAEEQCKKIIYPFVVHVSVK